MAFGLGICVEVFYLLLELLRLDDLFHARKPGLFGGRWRG